MPQINIRWADNTAELRQRLKEGIGTIDAMKASVEKTVQAMGGQGLFRAANNAAAAIQQLGGVTKLTTAEQQRHLVLLDKAIEKYRVMGQTAPAAMKQIADDMRKVVPPTQNFSNVLGLATKTLGAFGISLGVGAVVSFGRAIIASADSLTKMHDKTGISLQGLQKFQIVADEAGNTLDQLTMATNQMQNRLAGNDQSAVAALNKLGLSLTDLKRQAPDQQFMAIAAAIRGIQDPAEQVNVAMDIFGRQGAEILPTIKRGFDDVADAAVGMSDDTVKALDRTGDAIDRLLRRGKGLIGQVIGQAILSVEGTGTGLFNVAETQRRAVEAGIKRGDIHQLSPLEQATLGAPQFEAPFMAPTVAGIPTELDEIIRTLASKHAILTNAEDARKKAAAESEKAFKAWVADWDAVQEQQSAAVKEAITTVTATHGGQVAALMKHDQRRRALMAQTMGTMRLDSSSPFASQRDRWGDRVGGPMQTLAGFTPGLGLKSMTSGGIFTGLGDQFKTAIPQAILQSFAGGGSPIKAVGSLMGSQLGTSLVSKVGGSITGLLGKTVGGAVNALLPGIGSLIGPGLSALVGGIKKLFGGPGEKELEGRDVKKQFQDSFGSFEKMLGTIADAYRATGRTADMARKDVERLMAAEKQGGEAVKAVIEDITKVFTEQKAQWQGAQDGIAALNSFAASGIDTAGKFSMVSQNALTLFSAWVEKTGDFLGALEQLGPALDALAEGQRELGFEGNEAITKLLGLRVVVQEQKPLMDNIATSTQLLKAMAAAGLLNTTNIVAFGQNAVNQFTLLKGATGDANQAMVLMQPELQVLWEHQEKFGKFADEATQALIDQAETQGLVGPDMKSDQDKLLDVMKEIRDTLFTIVGIEIPDKTFKVTPVIDPIVIPDQATQEPGWASTGGLVTRTGIQRFAPQYLSVGGFVGMQSLFRPRGRDTQHIMAEPGELILNAAQQGRLADALGNGARTEGSVPPLQVQLLFDGRVLTTVLIENILKDQGGIRRVIKRVAA